ncbi:MAG: ABC transporter ATP-binding protein, partial [Sarcina sp.]
MSNKKSSMGFGGGRGNVGTGEKARNFKGSGKRLLKYLKPFKIQLIFVIIMTILSTAFTVLSPKILGDTLNVILDGMIEKFKRIPGGGIDFSKLGHYIIILLCLYVLSSLFLYLQKYIMSGVAQNTVLGLRTAVDEKLHRLPINYFDTHPQGDVLSRVTNDIDTIASTLQQSLTQLITAVITIIGITIMMLTISPLLTLICIVTLPICFLVAMPLIKKSQRFFFNQQRQLGALSGHVEEIYSGHTVIKSFGQEKDSTKKFDEINGKLYSSAWKAQFMANILMPIMSLISNIAYVGIAVVGGIMVINGKLQVGYIQSFIQYSKQFTQQITQTTNIASVLQTTMAAAERV